MATGGERPERRSVRWRPRIGIATKLLLGFGALTGLVVALASTSILIVERTAIVNESILLRDVPLLDAANSLLEEVTEQEFYARQAAIPGNADLIQVVREERVEFEETLSGMARIPGTAHLPLRRIGELHAAYSDLREQAPSAPAGQVADAEATDREARAVLTELLGLIRGIAAEAQRERRRKSAQTERIGDRAVRLMVAAGAAAVLLSVVATILLTHDIANPIRRLMQATARIAAGHYDVVPATTRRDELGDLTSAFAEMTRRIKELEELNLDANSLTHLPGNRAIEDELRARLERQAPFVFCLADLDNFKAFNDCYGYARGSALILATAEVIGEAVRAHGATEDFIGHIGGDDFVIVTVPERYREICGAVVAAFDAMAPAHYDAEDIRRGYLRGKTRQGQPMRFPIITISIAAVISTEHKLESPIQLGELAADLKEYAKGLAGSVLVVDRRRNGEAAAEASSPIRD